MAVTPNPVTARTSARFLGSGNPLFGTVQIPVFHLGKEAVQRRAPGYR